MKHDSYYFGLWKTDLFRQLLWLQPWHISSNAYSLISPAKPDWTNIPSWSWAATEGKKLWHSIFTHYINEQDDPKRTALAELCQLDETLARSTIHVKGFLLKLSVGDSIFDVASKDREHPYISHYPRRRRHRVGCTFYLDHWFYKRWRELDSTDHVWLGSVAILPMIHWRLSSNNHVTCLLLWTEPSLPRGTYCRVGGVQMCARFGDDTATVDFYRQAFRERQGRLQVGDYLVRNGDGNCVVSLV